MMKNLIVQNLTFLPGKVMPATPDPKFLPVPEEKSSHQAHGRKQGAKAE
jgi:hypothetical protein